MRFSYRGPGEIIFGEGVLEDLPSLLSARNLRNVLVVSDCNIEKSGLTGKVGELLAAKGIQYMTYCDVEPNPSTETVHRGAEIFKDNKLEGIVCVGGGSPMDTAKAVSVIASNGGTIEQYEGVDKVTRDVFPVIAIPTTAGTGSEVTPFSVITDLERNYKLTVVSRKTIPEVALLDPSLLATVPFAVATSTGIDAFIHALESYLSLAANPFSEMYAEKAMALIGKNIRPFSANRENSDAAAGMLLGSLFAAIAFSLTRLGNIHAMSHPLSGFFKIPHGIANAVLLPYILEYNALADQGKYEVIHRFLRPEAAGLPFQPEILIAEINKLYEDLEIPKDLTTLGVDRKLVPQMAADAIKSGNIQVNPRKTELSDLENLYYRAF